MVIRAEGAEHQMMRAGLGRLRGKVAIVTAADSGIGRASARLFAREGARVVCVDVQESVVPRIDHLIQQDGGEAVFLQGDVASRTTCDRMVAAALSEFSGLDILYNNAGSHAGRGPLHQLTDDQWNWVVELNLNSVYHGVRAALPHFLGQGRGTIVNNASSLGILASRQNPAYSTTKAAVIMLTRQLALDYGPAIRVNCVCAGPIETYRFRGNPPRAESPQGMTEEGRDRGKQSVAALQRMGQPEEVAYAVLFLVSDESSFVTGHALVVDGGQTLDA